MNCLVTGAAGFIGSHLCERLLDDGHHVLGLDAFIPYYPRAVKQANLHDCRQHSNFTFLARDLRTDPLHDLAEQVDAVFHLAAMPGLARSWSDFELYSSCNLQATHRLLEAVHQVGRVQRFVYASTSSVYGRFASGDETLPTRPISPYGVTKLAAENLCHAFLEQGLPLVVLRYFSVYGPRQRPDMGYHQFIARLLQGQAITVCGDGLQARGNTFVTDAVAATALALQAPVGETYNVGGGEAASVWDILGHLEQITGLKAQIERAAARPGDQRSTFADTNKLRRHLGWQAHTSLDQGLAMQVAWQRQLMQRLAA